MEQTRDHGNVPPNLRSLIPIRLDPTTNPGLPCDTDLWDLDQAIREAETFGGDDRERIVRQLTKLRSVVEDLIQESPS